MPHNKNDRSAANAFIERLFRDGYHDYVPYTEINLQNHGSKYLSVSGCADDVVQEAFYLICERAEEVMNSESPVGWRCTNGSPRARTNKDSRARD